MQQSDSEILKVDCFLQNRLLCPLLRGGWMMVSKMIVTWGHLLAVPLRPQPVWIRPNRYIQQRRIARVGSQPAWIVISESDIPTWGYDQEEPLILILTSRTTISITRKKYYAKPVTTKVQVWAPRRRWSEVDNVRLRRHSVRETREISTVIVFAGRV